MVNFTINFGKISAIKATTLNVAFNKAIDTTKAAFTVKKGTVNVNVSKVEWNDAKTVAGVTLVSKMTKGDYTVSVAGLSTTAVTGVATVEDEKVGSIELSDVAPLISGNTNVTFNYVVKNQYGEDITSSSSLTWTASQGSFATDPSTGVKELDGSFVKDQTVVVTALDVATGTFATKQIKVGDPSKVADITIGGLYNKDGKTLFTDSTFTDFYIKVSAVDQYGNKVAASALNDAAQTTIVVPPTSIVGKGSVVTIPGTTDLGLQLAKPTSNIEGTATVRFISNYTGKSASIDVNVAKAAALDTIVLTKPDTLVVKGEKVIIPFNAYDQNGVELTEAQKDAISDTLVTCTDSKVKFSFAYNYQTKKTELTMDLTDPAVTIGNKIVMAVTPTGKLSQFTVEVKDTAVPKAVAATKDIVKLMTVGGVSSLTANNFTVIDQYDREMTLDSTWFTTYKLALTSATPAYVTVGAGITAADGNANLTGVAVGDSVVTVNVDKVSDSSVIANSNYDFTASTVDKANVVSYNADLTANKILDDGTHTVALDVYGLTSTNEKVALKAGDIAVTSSDAAVTYDTGKLTAANTVAGLTETVTEVPVNLLVVVEGENGPVSIVKTITVTNVAAKVASIKTVTTSYVTVVGDTAYVKASDVNTTNLEAAFSGVDQYGADKTLTITNVLYDNIVKLTSGSALNITYNGTSTAAITGAAAGETFKITVFADGINRSLNVVVTE